MKCGTCHHWQPKDAPKGMAALGFAPCRIKSKHKGHTVSMSSICERYQKATDEAIQERGAHATTSG